MGEFLARIGNTEVGKEKGPDGILLRFRPFQKLTFCSKNATSFAPQSVMKNIPAFIFISDLNIFDFKISLEFQQQMAQQTDAASVTSSDKIRFLFG
jgi:hypothetical protein